MQPGPGGSAVQAPAAWDGSPCLAAALPFCMSTCPPPATVGADMACGPVGRMQRTSLLLRARLCGRRAGTGRAHRRHTVSQKAFCNCVTRLLSTRRTWVDAWPDRSGAAAPRAPASAWAGSCDGGASTRLAYCLAIQASRLPSQLASLTGRRASAGGEGQNVACPQLGGAQNGAAAAMGLPSVSCEGQRPKGRAAGLTAGALPPSALRAAAT